jgi:hypothetical protein
MKKVLVLSSLVLSVMLLAFINVGFGCQCPDGYWLSPNGQTCLPNYGSHNKPMPCTGSHVLPSNEPSEEPSNKCQGLQCMDNEPDNFRGIKWGADIRDLPEMKLIEDDGNSKFYHRKNDKMKIGEADINEITYGFYKKRLYAITVRFYDIISFGRLKKTLVQQYRLYYQSNPYIERYTWYGHNITVVLEYSNITKKGSLFYWYKPIADEKERDEKEAAKKGAKDL